MDIDRDINRLRRLIADRSRDRNDVTELRRKLTILLEQRSLESATQPHPRTEKGVGFV